MQASIAWEMHFGEKSAYGLREVANSAHVVCYLCTVSVYLFFFLHMVILYYVVCSLLVCCAMQVSWQ